MLKCFKNDILKYSNNMTGIWQRKELKTEKETDFGIR